MNHFTRSLALTLATLTAAVFAHAAGSSEQRLTVKGSVVNTARAGSTSEMEIANSRGKGAQQSVHIKGSVINESAGRRARSKVSIGSK